jgi:hybrid cluster-associated redox disulfide protein
MENENKTPQITPDMLVAEVLDRWPQTAPVFLSNHAYCIGCSMSIFDTLAEAACNYHIPLENFVAELEQARQSSDSA